MEFKSGPNPENVRAVKCLIMSDSLWDAACGLGVIYHHYVPTLELAFTDTLCESQQSKEWSDKDLSESILFEVGDSGLKSKHASQ